MNKFNGRLGIQQRVVPNYRAPFFELLANSCTDGLSVFSGKPRPIEGIVTTDRLNVVHLKVGKNIHILDPSSPFYICWQHGLLEWLRSWNPDSIIIEANPRYPTTFLAILWMHSKGKPVLGWGLGVPQDGNKVEGFLRNKFLKSLDGVISYSSRGADEYRLVGLSNIFVAHNAVSPSPKTAPRGRSNYFEGRPNVLFIGRLQTRKRIDLLLAALKGLPEYLQPEVFIVGDGPEKHKLEALAENVYPLAKFVGSKHGDELLPYLDQSDLFVLPGTGGLAIQQAMSHGLPVIAAKGDGTQDDLVRSVNGWQVKPGDKESLTSTLLDALRDVKRLRRMGQESYRIVLEEVNLENMVDVFVKALNSARGDGTPVQG
jgi:glycosyltransferase involved in cell wall biosynthesis